MIEVISVIVPFFNRVPELRRALKSVREQDYPVIEVLVVDDGSTDDTSEIENLCRENAGWFFFQNDINKGVSVARNVGISKAVGDWIAFLDSDDVWLPNKLSLQLDYMKRNGYEACHTSYFRNDSRSPDKSNKKVVRSGKFTYRYPWILFSCRIATPTVVVSSQLLKTQFFDEGLRFMEDQDCWSKLAKTTMFYGLDEPLTIVNFSNQSSALDLGRYRAGMLGLRSTFLSGKKSLFLLHFIYSEMVYWVRLVVWSN